MKVYAIGEHYAYAETRKSPEVDGLVERSESGLEKRQETALQPAEAAIATQVVRCFRQRICGFDLLRSLDGALYVCDVNGLSFVKDNMEYFAKCGQKLAEMFASYMEERASINDIHNDRTSIRLVCFSAHSFVVLAVH